MAYVGMHAKGHGPVWFVLMEAPHLNKLFDDPDCGAHDSLDRLKLRAGQAGAGELEFCIYSDG
jgi:hypothetical protein